MRSGTVSMEELKKAMEHPSVRNFLDDINMPFGILPDSFVEEI